jgi:predicted nucleotidyltransferase
MVGRGDREQKLQAELGRIINKIDRTAIYKMILFGSLARGDVGLASDIDLIIVKETKEPFLRRLEAIYQDIEPNIAIDILVYTPEEFSEMSQWSSFIKRVLKEGRVLYEA